MSSPSSVSDYDVEKSLGGLSSFVSSHGAYSRHSHRSRSSHRSPSTPEYDGDAKDHERRSTMSAKAVGRALGARIVRGVKRGNLPFMLVFTIALLVFVGALAGVGYVDPNAPRPEKASQEFEPGQPVFDAREAQAELEKQIKLQREREAEWRRAARPGAGAWMRDHRDDGARRPADISAEEAAALARADEEKLRLHERNALRGLEARVAELEEEEAGFREEVAKNDALAAKIRALEAEAKAVNGEGGEKEGEGEGEEEDKPVVRIDPKTGLVDEKYGMSAAEVWSHGRNLENQIEKNRLAREEVEGKIDEFRRRLGE